MLYNCNLKSINPCTMGLWKCYVSWTLKGYLVFMNSLINPRKRGFGIHEPMYFCWKKVFERLLGVHKRRKKGLCYVAFSSTFKRLIKLRLFFINVVCSCPKMRHAIFILNLVEMIDTHRIRPCEERSVLSISCFAVGIHKSQFIHFSI